MLQVAVKPVFSSFLHDYQEICFFQLSMFKVANGSIKSNSSACV